MQQAVLALAKKIESYGGTVGVHVVDLASGRQLATHAAGSAFNPASNMKIVTAATALWKQGANHKYPTALYARRSGSTDTTVPDHESGASLSPGPRLQRAPAYQVPHNMGFHIVERWQFSFAQVVKSTR